MTSEAAQQYLDIVIQDDLKYDIRIENAHVQSGEFYNNGDPNDVLTADEIDDMGIRHNGGRRHVCSSGEPGCASGPEGIIDLMDDVANARICTLAWNASLEPGKQNMFMMRNLDERYEVEIGKWNEFGTMGEVPVAIREP
ncbi:Asp hemolysin-like protein [Aspergillus sp. HF37]|nr:Asp hemolysin-like protein [Aspergillus sp. HF37]